MNLNPLARVVCRPALLRDTPDMLELTRHIWDGNDYLPQVWDEWLADPEGFLAVAEYNGQVVGIAMLEYQQQGEWYLAGLRVHPKMEGRGIASRLHEYMLDTWQRSHRRGAIRLATYRPKVKHLCERTGFRLLCEFSFFVTTNLSEPVETFTPMAKDQIDQALALLYSSPVFDWHSRMYCHGWSWSSPQPKFIEQAREQGRTWMWREGLGVLVTGEDRDDDGISVPFIKMVACPSEYLPEILLDYRRLATVQGYQKVTWVASLHPDLQPYLVKADFKRDWDGALALFERVID
jgi:N-acetylglutamate synthase-like GNAT family acetyltransferase